MTPQTKTRLIKTSLERMLTRFPDYVGVNLNYFLIESKGRIVGLFFIKEREKEGDKGVAEVSLHLFEAFRSKNIITRTLLNKLIKIPFKEGFTEFWTYSTWKSWTLVLDRFKGYGLKRSEELPFWDKNPKDDGGHDKIWFIGKSLEKT